MKLDNTAAPMESSTSDDDTQITVCKTYFLVSIYYGIMSKQYLLNVLDYRCYEDLKFTILFIRREYKKWSI